jgi:hypothetical protein
MLALSTSCDKKPSQFAAPDRERTPTSDDGSATIAKQTPDESATAIGSATTAPTANIGSDESAAAAEFLRNKERAEATQRPVVPPANKETISNAQAEVITQKGKDALVTFADNVVAANGDCKKIATVLRDFAKNKSSIFRDIVALESKLTAAQRKVIEDKFQPEIAKVGQRMTPPLAACTKDPDLIAAMAEVQNSGVMTTAPSAAAKPTAKDPQARATLDVAMAQWAQATSDLAMSMSAAGSDCSKVALALKPFTDKAPALLDALQAVLPSVGPDDLKDMQTRYAPQMDKMEATITPLLKACEKDPAVAELAKKLPKAR